MKESFRVLTALYEFLYPHDLLEKIEEYNSYPQSFLVKELQGAKQGETAE